MQRDALHPQNSLIASIPVRSPQMLNLDSRARWQQAARQQMTSFKRVARGRDVKSWQTVRASVHILSRPWQASPCMNSKLVKPRLDSFWSDIHHVDQCWFHCTVSTMRCFGDRPVTSVKASQKKPGPIWLFCHKLLLSFGFEHFSFLLE